ncbi:MAG: hypothetical protein AAF530_11730 [Pseudomonadota bacterium]
MTDTVENRLNLADELCAKGQPEDAIDLYKSCIDGPFSESPDILSRLVRAHFLAESWENCCRAYRDLRGLEPDGKWQEEHLLFARALEAKGNINEAIQSYDDLCTYYTGPEAKCRFGLLLKAAGRNERAATCFKEVLQGAKHAPPAIRRRFQEWIDLADQELRV